MTARASQLSQRNQIRRNALKNPGFERLSPGTTILRRNYHINPGCNGSQGFSSWSGASGNSVERSTYTGTAFPYLGAAAQAFQWTSVTGDASNGDFGVSMAGMVTPGIEWTVEYDVTSRWTRTLTAPSPYASSGSVTVTAKSRTSQEAMSSLVPSRRWATFIADATAIASGLRCIQTAINKNQNDTYYISDVVLYPGPKQEYPWFSGSTSFPATGLTYAWEGDVDNSPSIERGAGTTILTNPHTNPRAMGPFSTSAAGSTSQGSTVELTGGPLPDVQEWRKIVITGAPTSSPFTFWSTATANHPPVSENKTYLFSIYGISDYIGWAGIRCDITWLNSAGTAIGSTVSGPISALTAPNVWERRNTIVLTAPAGATSVRVGMAFSGGQGMTVPSYIGISGVMIDPDTATGLSPFWDGGTINPPDLVTAYTGTSKQSGSIMQGGIVDAITPSSGQTSAYSSLQGAKLGRRFARHRVLTTSSISVPAGDIVPGTGSLWSLYLWVRPTRQVTVRPRIRATQGADFVCPANVWTPVWLTAAAGTGSIGQTGLILVGGSGGHQVGDLIDVDGATMTPGYHIAGSIDGDFRGSRWAGAQYQSDSYGYPLPREEPLVTLAARVAR